MHRVLVVDDDRIVLSATLRMLPRGLETLSATNAEDALDLVRTHPVDAVVSDYLMPRQNGLWLLERVREEQPGVLRVLTSGVEPDQLEQHLASGLVQRWLPKPSNRSAIAACLAPRGGAGRSAPESREDSTPTATR